MFWTPVISLLTQAAEANALAEEAKERRQRLQADHAAKLDDQKRRKVR